MEAELPKLGLRRLPLLDEPSPRSRSTIIIGENGSGKSTLLRELALTFRKLGSGGPRRLHGASWTLLRDLVIFSNNEWLRLDERRLKWLIEAHKESAQPPEFLPSKVIALSFTPFDKFPHFDVRKRDDTPPSMDDYYVYLGFRTDNGQASPKSRLLKTVDQLVFRPDDDEKDLRVAQTLAAIGYAPVLRLGYLLSPLLRRFLQDRRAGRSPSVVYSGRSERLEAQAKLFEQHAQVLEGFWRLRPDDRLWVRAHFGPDPRARLDADPELLQLLQREGVLNVAAVELESYDRDAPVDLLDLSSGELNILSGFLGLAVHLVDGCLVLIDEPENSLHPAWQIRYAEMLDAILDRFGGCHCIVATHSPLVVSGAAARGSSILRLDRDPVTPVDRGVAEESPDATLVNAFDLLTPHNSYVRQVVLEALTLIQRGEARSTRAIAIAKLLVSIRDQVPTDDPIGEVINAVIQRVAA